VPNTIMGAVLRIVDSGHTNSAWPPCVGLAAPVCQVRTIITIIDCQDLRNSSGSFAMFAAIRRASSLVSNFGAIVTTDRRSNKYYA
jgi:hypothetical protein